MNRRLKITALLGAMTAAVACSPIGVPVSMATYSEPEPMRVRANGPPNAAPGSCWGRDVTPAIIETVTEQIQLQPPEVDVDGTVRAQAIYKTEIRQAIVRERKEIWFETPCESQLTADFVASLQRALDARGHYRGTITGQLDARTRKAVRNFQAPQGLNSSILSLVAARQLGLAAYDFDKG